MSTELSTEKDTNQSFITIDIERIKEQKLTALEI